MPRNPVLGETGFIKDLAAIYRLMIAIASIVVKLGMGKPHPDKFFTTF
ncbi:hypothetical protein [Tolypothrix sp. VBCCA 56010]